MRADVEVVGGAVGVDEGAAVGGLVVVEDDGAQVVDVGGGGVAEDG
jgi:hypothetical protein